jgi:hypothetical protein
MSALYPISDSSQTSRHVRKVRNSDIDPVLNDFICAPEQCDRNRNSKPICNLQTDDQFDGCRLLYRQVGRAFTIKNPPRIVAYDRLGLRNAASIADNTARLGEVGVLVGRRDAVI